MTLKIITTTNFYKEHSSWIEQRKYDNDGMPLRIKDGKRLQTYKRDDGYLSILIKTNAGKLHLVPLHRFIGLVFLDNPNNFEVINHKNGIKNDCRIDNLEWTSQSYNMHHAFKNKLITPYKKPITALNVETKETLSFDSRKSCGEYFNIAPKIISTYIRRKLLLRHKWLLSFTNENDNDRIDESVFYRRVKDGEIKEHSIYKGYYADLINGKAISFIHGSPRILKPRKSANRYRISFKRYAKSISLSKFIFECGIGESLDSNKEVYHKDKNIENNNFNNLFSVSHDNKIYETSKNVKIVFEDGRVMNFSSISETARFFNLTFSTIVDWIKGRRKGFILRNIKTITIV